MASLVTGEGRSSILLQLNSANPAVQASGASKCTHLDLKAPQESSEVFVLLPLLVKRLGSSDPEVRIRCLQAVAHFAKQVECSDLVRHSGGLQEIANCLSRPVTTNLDEVNAAASAVRSLSNSEKNAEAFFDLGAVKALTLLLTEANNNHPLLLEVVISALQELASRNASIRQTLVGAQFARKVFDLLCSQLKDPGCPRQFVLQCSQAIKSIFHRDETAVSPESAGILRALLPRVSDVVMEEELISLIGLIEKCAQPPASAFRPPLLQTTSRSSISSVHRHSSPRDLPSDYGSNNRSPSPARLSPRRMSSTDMDGARRPSSPSQVFEEIENALMADTQGGAFNQDLRTSSAAIQDSHQEIVQLRKEKISLMGDLRQSEEANTRLKLKVEDLQQQLEQERIQEHDNRITSARLTEFYAELEKAKKENVAVVTQRDELEEKVAKLAQDNEGLAAIVEALRSQNDAMRRQLFAEEAKVDAARKEIQVAMTKSDRSEANATQWHELASELDLTRKALSEEQYKSSVLEGDVVRLTEEKNRLKIQSLDLAGDKKRLQSEVDLVSDKMANKLQFLLERNLGPVERNEDLQKELEKSKKQLDTAQSSIQELYSQYSSLIRTAEAGLPTSPVGGAADDKASGSNLNLKSPELNQGSGDTAKQQNPPAPRPVQDVNRLTNELEERDRALADREKELLELRRAHDELRDHFEAFRDHQQAFGEKVATANGQNGGVQGKDSRTEVSFHS